MISQDRRSASTDIVLYSATKARQRQIRKCMFYGRYFVSILYTPGLPSRRDDTPTKFVINLDGNMLFMWRNCVQTHSRMTLQHIEALDFYNTSNSCRLRCPQKSPLKFRDYRGDEALEEFKRAARQIEKDHTGLERRIQRSILIDDFAVAMNQAVREIVDETWNKIHRRESKGPRYQWAIHKGMHGTNRRPWAKVFATRLKSAVQNLRWQNTYERYQVRCSVATARTRQVNRARRPLWSIGDDFQDENIEDSDYHPDSDDDLDSNSDIGTADTFKQYSDPSAAINYRLGENIPGNHRKRSPQTTSSRNASSKKSFSHDARGTDVQPSQTPIRMDQMPNQKAGQDNDHDTDNTVRVGSYEERTQLLLTDTDETIGINHATIAVMQRVARHPITTADERETIEMNLAVYGRYTMGQVRQHARSLLAKQGRVSI